MDVTELAMMLNTLEIQPVNPKEFQEAAGIAKEFMNKLDQEQQMFFYGLFKQASVGDTNIEKPDKANVVEYYKW
jgi:acyl-CoA-binding protein